MVVAQAADAVDRLPERDRIDRLDPDRNRRRRWRGCRRNGGRRRRRRRDGRGRDGVARCDDSEQGEGSCLLHRPRYSALREDARRPQPRIVIPRMRGVTFVRGPSVETYGTVAVFEDLYGNRFDLIGRKAAP